MAKKKPDYNDPDLFQFGTRTGSVKVTSWRKFGKKSEAVTSLSLSVTVKGVGAIAVAIVLGAKEDQVRAALWDVGAIERGVPLDGVPPLLRAAPGIASDATFTQRHMITIGDLEPERCHILQGFHVKPTEGCTAEVTFTAVIHEPRGDFLANLSELLRDPVEVSLLQDPELPLADVRHGPRDDGGDDGGDDQGGLPV